MTEHLIQQRILLAHGSGDTRLWRNNVGTGWAGQSSKVTSGNLRAMAASLRPGDVIIRGGRPLHAGLCVGSSDLVGYRSEIVTPQMLGTRVAIFSAVEVKSATGRPTEAQRTFISHIRAAGGRSGIARSVQEAGEILAPS